MLFMNCLDGHTEADDEEIRIVGRKPFGKGGIGGRATPFGVPSSKMARPTRFERVTSTFGGQQSGSQAISWSRRMYARRLSQAAKRNALQRRCEIDPLSGTSCANEM
jgi:hypothetical protein